VLGIYLPDIQDLNILNILYTSTMGFLDKLKRGIAGGKDKAGDVKDAAARAQKAVDDSADKAKRAVDDSADKAKRAADKADNAVDDAAAASDELKKD
jgi:F0F1-type ATP synthase membrane subunit b/b'